jgi:hypothetical protein
MSERPRGTGNLLLAAGAMVIALAVFSAAYFSGGSWGAAQEAPYPLDEVRTYLVEEAKAGSRSITVADPTGFNPGDCFGIRDADDFAWEDNAIVDIADNVFHLQTALTYLHPPFTPVVRWGPCPTPTPWPTPPPTTTPKPTSTPQAAPTLPPEATPTLTPTLEATPTPSPKAAPTPVSTPTVLPPMGMGQSNDGHHWTATQGLLALGCLTGLTAVFILAWHWPRHAD